MTKWLKVKYPNGYNHILPKENLVNVKTMNFHYFKEKEAQGKRPSFSFTKANEALRLFFKKVSIAIIEEKYTFKISRLGEIRIAKYKQDPTKKAIDWKNTNLLGKTVYHLNKHSNGYSFRWLWKKGFAARYVRHSRLYRFQPIRGTNMAGQPRRFGKRGLAAYVKKCSEDPTLKDYDCLPMNITYW